MNAAQRQYYASAGLNLLLRAKNFLGWAQMRCVACLEPFSIQDCLAKEPFIALCPDCRARVPRRNTGYCPYCGEPAQNENAELLPCGACLESRPPWRNFRFYGIFANLLRQILLKGKYGNDMASLELLGRFLLLACVDLEQPDAIVPMPLHSSRLKERGYNQSREISRPLARRLDCPINDGWLYRIIPTTPQTGLPRNKRLQNLNGAFAANEQVAGRHILLVDDTATTCASLKAAVNALLVAGAATVDVTVVARASQFE